MAQSKEEVMKLLTSYSNLMASCIEKVNATKRELVTVGYQTITYQDYSGATYDKTEPIKEWKDVPKYSDAEKEEFRRTYRGAKSQVANIMNQASKVKSEMSACEGELEKYETTLGEMEGEIGLAIDELSSAKENVRLARGQISRRIAKWV